MIRLLRRTRSVRSTIVEEVVVCENVNQLVLLRSKHKARASLDRGHKISRGRADVPHRTAPVLKISKVQGLPLCLLLLLAHARVASFSSAPPPRTELDRTRCDFFVVHRRISYESLFTNFRISLLLVNSSSKNIALAQCRELIGFPTSGKFRNSRPICPNQQPAANPSTYIKSRFFRWCRRAKAKGK